MTVRAGGETFRGRWLVGCDGGRSTVRKAGGFEFVGTDPEFTGYSVEVEMADPDKLRPGRHYTPTGMYTYARPGTIAMVDFDGGAFHRTAADHARACAGGVAPRLRRRRHPDGASACHDLDGSRLPGDGVPQGAGAARGRRRAHPFTPGRPGAQPRAWRRDEPRLEAGRHDPRRRAGGLLDSYSSERHPVGAQVLDWSRAQVALMRPSPEFARARSHHPRSHRHARRRDLFRRARLGRFSPLRSWRQPSAGGPQRSRLRTGRRDEARRTPQERKRPAAGL